MVVLEKTLQSPLDSKEIKPINSKENQPWILIRRTESESPVVWIWSSRSVATWCKGPTHWKRPWCWERLKAVGEGDGRGWDGWMASWLNRHEFEQTPIKDRETWFTAVARGHKVGHNWATEQRNEVGTQKDRSRDRKGLCRLAILQSLVCYLTKGGSRSTSAGSW